MAQLAQCEVREEQNQKSKTHGWKQSTMKSGGKGGVRVITDLKLMVMQSQQMWRPSNLGPLLKLLQTTIIWGRTLGALNPRKFNVCAEQITGEVGSFEDSKHGNYFILQLLKQ
jgi:hypothetical protein